MNCTFLLNERCYGITMNVFEYLKGVLENARKRGVKWVELGEALNTLKRDPDTIKNYSSKENFWNSMAHKSGHSANALQRMESSFCRIREIERANKNAIKEALKLTAWEEGILFEILKHYPKAEIFTRIYRQSPTDAWILLRRMRAEDVSINQMKAIFRNIKSAGPERQTTPEFKHKAPEPPDHFSVIEAHKDDFYSSDQAIIFVQRYRFPLVSPGMVALGSNDGEITFVDAFEVITNLRQKSRKGYQELLPEIVFKSTYFRHLWLFISDPRDLKPTTAGEAPAKQLIDTIVSLGIHRIGVIANDKANGIKILRRPQGNDRPTLYENALREVMRQGVPNLGAA